MLEASNAKANGDSYGYVFAQRKVQLFTEQLNESNPLLTAISDAMTKEGVLMQVDNPHHKKAKLVDLTEGSHIERELMLVKVRATGVQRDEVKRTVDIFRGCIVDMTSSIYTIQITGKADKLDGFLQALGAVHILEVVRTGVSGVARGEKILSI